MSNSPLSFDDTSTAFAIRSNAELKRSFLLFSSMKYPWMVKAGTILTAKALQWRLPVKGLIRKTLFKQFCGGESIQDCQHTINQLAKFRSLLIKKNFEEFYQQIEQANQIKKILQ